MAKLGVFRIRGKSGAEYAFDAYPPSTVWAPIGAVYIVSHRDVRIHEPAEHICLRLGQIQNLQGLAKLDAEWCGHRANCICVLLEAKERRRNDIMADLLGVNDFPLSHGDTTQGPA